MKLIIDIPKGTYKAIEVGTINQVLEYKVWNAIKNGTPLDDVKAEIDKEWACTHHMYPEYASGLARASEIIDKCTEKESEE